MKFSSTRSRLKLAAAIGCVAVFSAGLISSSHREAPGISEDRQADNTDVYAFKSPNNPNGITLIANYVPAQLAGDGPNYYHFSPDVRYEIHIDNNIATPGDDIIYRWTFTRVNEDPTTFFIARLGKENLKTTYTLQRSTNGGASFQTIITNGVVPPPPAGPRVLNSPVGLNGPSYRISIGRALNRASTGELSFVGTVDDPFFVDAGGAFDLGDLPRTNGGKPQDLLRCKNVLTIAIEVPVSTLQKDGKTVEMSNNIFDPTYVIGVWANASRQKVRILNNNGTQSNEGPWVQVSRLGMPLTNEVIIPIGMKDRWNAASPYDAAANAMFAPNFYNPELALYMDDALFGPFVPAFAPLRIQKNSLGMFGFGNGQNGLFPLKGTAALNGTALAESAFGSVLLPGPGRPRSVDIFPLFHTGVPNLPPYQLAVQKGGNPLAPGKPFINNFLPNGGDMLRLNMKVPATLRNSPDFSSEGLLKAAVLGLTDPRFNGDKSPMNIPNLDGFPNGRRLEDDVTRIELQAVSGIVLAVLGLWYDDFVPGGSPLTPKLFNVLNYNTGINRNDTDFRNDFPFMQLPWQGNGTTNICKCEDDGRQTAPPVVAAKDMDIPISQLRMAAPEMMVTTQNPVVDNNTVRYNVTTSSRVKIVVYDALGQPLKTLVDRQHEAGTYSVQWNTNGLTKGTYMITANKNGSVARTVQVVKQ